MIKIIKMGEFHLEPKLKTEDGEYYVWKLIGSNFPNIIRKNNNRPMFYVVLNKSCKKIMHNVKTRKIAIKLDLIVFPFEMIYNSYEFNNYGTYLVTKEDSVYRFLDSIKEFAIECIHIEHIIDDKTKYCKEIIVTGYYNLYEESTECLNIDYMNGNLHYPIYVDSIPTKRESLSSTLQRTVFLNAFTDAFTIKDVKFSGIATIVFWKDGTKTVVKQQKNETLFDPEKAIMAAFTKKIFNNMKGSCKSKSMNNIFDKYIDKFVKDSKNNK